MSKSQTALALPVESRILVLRHQKVILEPIWLSFMGPREALNEQIKRNQERFPSDFMFQLNPEEQASLRSQSATSNQGRGRRYAPYAFTSTAPSCCHGA